MTFYATLNEALTDIASRSFYEDATVTPTEGGFTVEDDFSTSYAGDTIQWTYDGGMEVPANVTEHSRLHEPAEYYDDARHISYNLPAAIEALELGRAVTFAYAIVDAYCERTDDNAEADHDACVCLECDSGGSETIGWTLLAFDLGQVTP